MEIKPIKAKIVAVTVFSEEGLYTDSIMLNFDYGKGIKYGEFASPELDATNIRMWRKVILLAVRGESSKDDSIVNSFKSFKAEIFGKEVYVMYSGQEVIGIGKDSDNIFYPDAYQLWDDVDLDDDDE
ncbi:MAG: hypothetical protein LBG88_00305 [Christensenellaceae bacterium]|jgi:hypothetical protein|nr:hypothetical protein [Christensenellaceae bacterium]